MHFADCNASITVVTSSSSQSQCRGIRDFQVQKNFDNFDNFEHFLKAVTCPNLEKEGRYGQLSQFLSCILWYLTFICMHGKYWRTSDTSSSSHVETLSSEWSRPNQRSRTQPGGQSIGLKQTADFTRPIFCKPPISFCWNVEFYAWFFEGFLVFTCREAAWSSRTVGRKRRTELWIFGLFGLILALFFGIFMPYELSWKMSQFLTLSIQFLKIKFFSQFSIFLTFWEVFFNFLTFCRKRFHFGPNLAAGSM